MISLFHNMYYVFVERIIEERKLHHFVIEYGILLPIKYIERKITSLTLLTELTENCYNYKKITNQNYII